MSDGASPLSFTLFCVLLAGVVLIYSARKHRSRAPFPPGPTGVPLIGNILNVPTTYQWITYSELGKKFNSPLVHVTMFGAHIICVNDYKVAHEIFEKRGFRHGDRPRLMFLKEIAGHYWNFALSAPDVFYKKCRKVFDGSFKPSEVKLRMRTQFTNMAQGQILKRLLDSPGQFEHHFHSHTILLFLEIIFGLSADKCDDAYIHNIEKSLEAANLSGNYQFLDVFPWIGYFPLWFPGMSWKSKIAEWRACTRDFYEMPFNAVKKAMHNGTVQTSVASELLREEDQNKHGEEIIKATTSSGIGAGVDTMVAMMHAVIFCLMTFPDAQKAAQLEIDRVVGPNRLPDFGDEVQLPCVKAVYKEILRWACVAPLAIAHQSMEDDIWVHEGNEYFIPERSIMIGNAWAMCRDPDMYPNPESFDPRRFLTKNGELNPEVREADFPFGFRPRHCPGRWYAEDFLFIFIASLLSVFHIETQDGQPVETTEWAEVMTPGFIVYPKPFKCKISTRSETAEELIRNFDTNS